MYDAFEHPRRTRAALPLLERAQCDAYLETVRAAALQSLADADLGGAYELLLAGFVFNMLIQHEYQHNETMLATLQLMDAPGYRPDLPPRRSGSPLDEDMVRVDRGPFIMGTDDRTTAYDNERSAHEVVLPAYLIDAGPVSNAAYLEFMDDGGYRRPVLYTEAGRD